MSACGGGGDRAGGADVIPARFWGRWAPIATEGDDLYFSATGLRIGDSSAELEAASAASDLVVFAGGKRASLESDNVLSYDSARYLRATSASSSLKGALFDQSKLTGARALGSATRGHGRRQPRPQQRPQREPEAHRDDRDLRAPSKPPRASSSSPATSTLSRCPRA